MLVETWTKNKKSLLMMSQIEMNNLLLDNGGKMILVIK